LNCKLIDNLTLKKANSIAPGWGWFIQRFFVFIAGTLLLLNACNKSSNSVDSSSPVPNATVNISINISNNPYTGLQTVGGVIYLTNVGNRGILVYRLNASTIVAYDQTCTYDLPDPNGIVYAQPNGTAVCIDCGSAYSLPNGSVVTGPSTLGLKSYSTFFNQSTGALKITN
jgi:Rieske Fe-S protein